MAQPRPLGGLVSAAQSGDAAALSDLLEELAEQLLPLAAALAGQPGEAEVLLQDTLTRVFERIGQVRDRHSIGAWARRILIRSFIDERRSSRNQRIVELEVAAAQVAPERPDEFIDLRRAVERLPKRDRALLVMHYWLGLTLEDCAHEFGVPTGTAKSRLNAALRRLRASLGEQL